MLTTLFFACQPSVEPRLEDSALVTEPETTFALLGDDSYRVAQIDPQRYLGLWYEIATVPAGQQARCTGTTANYTSIDETTIGVLNECYIDSLEGPLSSINGTATPVDERFSHLLVNFGGTFSADYLVIEADGSVGNDPYSFAVVSSYGDAILWILYREPEMPVDLYETIIDRLEERDLDTSRLNMTVQIPD